LHEGTPHGGVETIAFKLAQSWLHRASCLSLALGRKSIPFEAIAHRFVRGWDCHSEADLTQDPLAVPPFPYKRTSIRYLYGISSTIAVVQRCWFSDTDAISEEHTKCTNQC
jgi:hypothetical protein